MFTIKEVDSNIASSKLQGVKNEHHVPSSLESDNLHAPSSSSQSFVKKLMEELGVSDEYYILGIDEAGRGPVVGPMIYTGVAVQLKEHDALVKCGVADSKQIDEARRNASLKKMRENLKSYSEFTHVVTPADIARDMFGPRGRTLNTLSHDTAIKIIVDATLKLCGKLCAVFVDTVGTPESYSRKLQGRFPHLHIVVRSKADSLFPVVSAASIVAKVTRDHEISLINQRIHRRGKSKQENSKTDSKEAQKKSSIAGEETENCPDYVGCGYPSDPRTMTYVRSHVHRFFVHSREDDCIRPSWAPVVDLANREEVCVPVLFEEDARRLAETKQDERLKRFKYEETQACTPAGRSGQKKINLKQPPTPRHPLFESLNMKPRFSSTKDLL